MVRTLVIASLVLGLALGAGGAVIGEARAQAQPEELEPAVPQEPPPYEERLLRLAEILGSVQYLRNLCNGEGETKWRETMQALLDSETENDARRRETLTAGYNRGFRAFASVYTSCTDAARLAETRYRREGATLVSEIVARFGN
ncbi:TIGR02301 family protein [Hoeflea sp.]|uniref:TIGR02301 family protein n=1 Tax=Hoeflea sp. TaxID=1940281 RepID=UPI003B51FC44